MPIRWTQSHELISNLYRNPSIRNSERFGAELRTLTDRVNLYEKGESKSKQAIARYFKMSTLVEILTSNETRFPTSEVSEGPRMTTIVAKEIELRSGGWKLAGKQAGLDIT